MDKTADLTLLDRHPRRKNNVLLLDIAIVSPWVSSNLENVLCHPGKHTANPVEQKKSKYRDSFPAIYSLLPLAVSTCGETEPDVHALIKELTTRWVEHKSEMHSDKSRHLAGQWK